MRVPTFQTHQNSRSGVGDVDRRGQLLRGNRAIGIPTHCGHLIPVRPSIEPHSQPSAAADVRRSKEPSRFSLDQLGLCACRRGTPQMGKVMIMVTVRPEHHELLAHEERGRAP